MSAIYVISMGPGDAGLTAPRAAEALEKALSENPYVEEIRREGKE